MTKIAHLHWCVSLDSFGRNDTPPSCNRGPFWMAAGRPGPSDVFKTGWGAFFSIILAGIGIGGPISRKLLHIITIGGTFTRQSATGVEYDAMLAMRMRHTYGRTFMNGRRGLKTVRWAAFTELI